MKSIRQPESRFLRVAASLSFVAALSAAQSFGQATPYGTISVSNQTMTARLSAAPDQPALQIDDLAAARKLSIPQLFAITLKDDSILQPSALHSQHAFMVENLPAASGKAAQQQVCADWNDPRSSADLHWCLLMRSGSSYLREQLTIRAMDKDLPIMEVRLLDFHDALAHVVGTVKGSPVVDEKMFFGFEHPLSWSRVVSGNVQAGISRELPLRAGQAVTYSAVIGTAQPGQMRRAFLAYLEEERPRPYQPFLHYNSWFDIGYENRYDETAALDRIHAFGEELVHKRNVKVDSFLFDDGWDDPASFWGFDQGFPDGFTRVAQAAKSIHAGVGVWLSPWGGYDEQKRQRVAFGKAHGYEIVRDGFALSGPKYFQGFSDVCLQMVDRYNVNQFKFDGTGNADRVFPGSSFDSDFDAAIHLIGRIRAEKPDIFINLTTGTYPSPFWLFYADSIWRGGEDTNFAGVGTSHQRWITYRDEQTYRHEVQGGPLFPLNSLMLHGIVYAKQAKDLQTDTEGDFTDEVRSYFGSGTQTQEMYITPSLLTAADWDVLASSAKWARDRAAILKDTHWIGGDPGKLQVYGWAAWAPTGWIITVRNPSDHPQNFQLNLGSMLELPSGTPTQFAVEQPFEASGSVRLQWQANRSVSLHLKPFEVQIFESHPSSTLP